MLSSRKKIFAFLKRQLVSIYKNDKNLDKYFENYKLPNFINT